MADVDRSTFRREVQQSESPGLARAALLFAREIAYPELQPSDYLAQIDRWANTVRQRFSPIDTTLSRVGRLCDFLFGTLRLRGNHEDYNDPGNSFLNEVMDRRLGLPITLSVLFIEVGRRAGLMVDGIGLPGHFIVGVRAEAGRYFFDPFNGGGEITADEAAERVWQTTGRSGRFDPAWLDPSPPHAIIARMLNNLQNAYVQREAWSEAVSVLERLCILQPEVPSHLRDLGLLHYRNQSRGQAASMLEAYLTRAPDAPDAALVRTSLTTLLDEYARLN